MAELDTQLLPLVEQALSAGPNGRAALASNPDYLEFQNEVKRIAGPTASGEPIDWKKMETMARSLAGLGADLMVYFHLSFAMVNTKGYSGLNASLSALKVLVERGWAFLTPVKQRGAYFEIFSRRIALEMKNRPPTPSESSAVEACDVRLSELNTLLGSNGARPLQEATEYIKGQLARLAPPPAPMPQPQVVEAAQAVVPAPASAPVSAIVPAPGAPTAAAPQEVQPPTAAGPTPVAAASQPAPAVPATQEIRVSAPPPVAAVAGGTSEESAPVGTDGKNRAVLERELMQGVERLTRVMREEDFSSPVPYRLLRGVVWAGAKEPLGDKQDKTRLPAPPPHLLKKVATAPGEGNPKELLRESEELFRTYPLWLDLQLRTARVLEQARANEALEAVKQEVGRLLSRLPGLLKLKFASGVPFAGEETVVWCGSLVAPATASGGGAGVAAAPSSLPVRPEAPRPVSVVYAPAVIPVSQDTAAENEPPLPADLGGGLAVLQARIMRSGSPRRRFELRIQVVDLCLRHARLDMATPLADVLEQEIAQHRLDEWDPELAAVALRQKLVVERARPTAETSPERRAQLWARLCMLNPSEAVALGPET